MTTLYLRTDTQADMEAALEAAGLTLYVLGSDGNPIGTCSAQFPQHTPENPTNGPRVDVDVIGLNPQELDQSKGCYDANGKPIWKAHTGFHVNVLTEDQATLESLAAVAVAVSSPLRMFA